MKPMIGDPSRPPSAPALGQSSRWARSLPVCAAAVLILGGFLDPLRPQETPRVGRVTHDQAVRILQSYEESVRKLPPVSMSFQSTFEVVDEVALKWRSRSARSEGSMRRDGSRSEIVKTEYALKPQSDQLFRNEHTQDLWDGGRFLRATRLYSPDGAEYRRRASVSVDPLKARNPIPPDLDGEFADGYLLDREHFAAALLRAEQLTASREIDAAGRVVTRFEGVLPKGTMEVWCVDSETPLFERAAFRYAPEFIEQLNKMTPELDEGLHGEEFAFEVKIIETERIDGILVTTKADRRNTTKYKGGERFRDHVVVVRSDIKFNPDFDGMGALRFDWPEGAPITNLDIPGLLVQLRGGQFVPYLDPKIKRSIDDLSREMAAASPAPRPQPSDASPPTSQARAADGSEVPSNRGHRAAYLFWAVGLAILIFTIVGVGVARVRARRAKAHTG